MTDNEYLSNPSFEHISSDEVFSIDPAYKNSGYGVPPELVPGIKDSLLRVLQSRGIDQSQVLYSGYNGLTPDPDTVKMADVPEDYIPPEELDAIVEYRRENIITHEDDKERYLSDTAIANSGLTRTPEYHFVGTEGLEGSEDERSNPIHFAGTGRMATIGVYDAPRLAQLSPGSPVLPDYSNLAWFTAHATAEEVNTAKILELHPRFRTRK